MTTIQITGEMLIGGTAVRGQQGILFAYDPARGEMLTAGIASAYGRTPSL